MNKFFVVRLDGAETADDWEGVANEFATLDEAKDFIREQAGAQPGVKFIAAQAITIGESPIPEVAFTDVA